MIIAWHSAETPLFGVCDACFRGIVNIYTWNSSNKTIMKI